MIFEDFAMHFNACPSKTIILIALCYGLCEAKSTNTQIHTFSRTIEYLIAVSMGKARRLDMFIHSRWVSVLLH